jgi:DNA-binding NarL/FixJ family response regulator
LPRAAAGGDRRRGGGALRHLVTGRTKREIAAELVLSPSTVHTHTVHIYAKCGVSTRAALAMFAMRHGLTAAAG